MHCTLLLPPHVRDIIFKSLLLYNIYLQILKDVKGEVQKNEEKNEEMKQAEKWRLKRRKEKLTQLNVYTKYEQTSKNLGK